MIDKALLRPGRLDKSILCDYPNFEERLETLKLYSDKLRANIEITDDDLDLNEISELTENYSYADLKGLICNAQLKAIDRIIDSNRKSTVSDYKGEDAVTPDEEGMINTNNLNEDEVYFTQNDIKEAFEEMGSKRTKTIPDFYSLTKDDIKKQKQILM